MLTDTIRFYDRLSAAIILLEVVSDETFTELHNCVYPKLTNDVREAELIKDFIQKYRQLIEEN